MTKININTSVNCQTRNIIYCVSCQKCRAQYIGQSERSLHDRFSEHKGYVVNSVRSKATGEHFNLPGHTVSDMNVTIVEKVYSRDQMVREERESMFIKSMNTKHKGLNKKT